ncbi:MAG: glycosyltransferase family 2 protein, partial [Acidimicrobiales bacterium]
MVVPVYDPPPEALAEAVRSVRAQTFERWELILVDDGSKDPSVRAALARAAASDPRVHLVRRQENGGVVAASNHALAEANGAFVALLDHDDLLEPEALQRCASAILSSGAEEVDYLYTDETRIYPDGSIALQKPDWSPERLRAQMYTGHLSVLRRELVERVGGFRPGFDGSQDYDLVLRVTERARKVVHVPEVLYQWRLLTTSVGQVGAPEVFAAARRALGDHLARTGRGGSVQQVDSTGAYRVRREVVGEPLVSIVIPTRGSSGEVWGERRVFVVDAVRSVLERSTYRRFELV